VRPTDDNQTVIYEVSLEAEAAIEGPFDTWLRDHVADMLQIDGFLSAEILVDPSPPPARIRRTVHYRLRNRGALDRYLREQAAEMRQRGVARFGDRFKAERRVLAHQEEFVGKVTTDNCLNCGEVLRGQHCSHCGQPAKVRVLSLWALIQDVLGDLLNADSRVWRTLFPLAFRPGLLTQDYLQGRRQRYTPPFRMYLVLSVVFFVLTSFEDPGQALEVNLGPNEANLQINDGSGAPDVGRTGPIVTDTQPGPGGPMYKARPLDEEARRLIEGIVARVPTPEKDKVRAELEREMSQASPADRAAARKFLADPCSEENLHVDIGADFDRYENRLRTACRKIVADQQGFGRALIDNVPKMMFIFLPLIAAVLGVLYLRSGRYYVEHLLFVVHFHAFFFLAGIVALLLDLLAGGVPAGAAKPIESVQGLLGVALVFYVPWYLYRALRRVYAQPWWKTVPKYAILGIAYLMSLVFTGIGLLAYTALTL
jgi:hypothetical protein